MGRARGTTQKPKGEPMRRSRKPSRRHSPTPRILLLTLAIPLVALFAWWLYNSRESFHLRTTPDRAEIDSSTPSLADALIRSGIERSRLKRKDDVFDVETLLTPDALARRVHENLPGARVASSGSHLDVRANGEKWRVNVHRLAVTDSGAGLVDTDDDVQRVPETPPAPTVTQPATVDHSRRKTIALILDDVGFERQPLDEASAIHTALTFAVIPNTPNAQNAARTLNARGFEILCHLPMEPDDYPRMNPGKGAIMTSMSDEEIRERTIANLQSIPFARGVNNHMGSRATADRRVMSTVLRAIRDEGAFFVDSRTSASSVGENLARELHVKTVARNVFLDDVERADEIRHQIDVLASLADKNGVAVGIGHVYPVTVSVLRREIPRLEREGYVFVPVSALVR